MKKLVKIIIFILYRRQRTNEEELKLRQVQVELQHMDQLIADDVKLLRKTIDSACIDFLEAQYVQMISTLKFF